MTPDPDPDAQKRRVRSFVLRAGRMTGAQQRGFDVGWSQWGVDYDAQMLDLDALFGGTGDKVLEIGFGMGQSLLQMADADPGRHYLGIEVHRPGVGSVLRGIELGGLNNLRVMCHDAVEVLENSVAPNTLSRIQIFFPDPWHKKRHHKRRLIQGPFVELLASRLAPGGVLHLATDWEPYAEHMLEVIEACDLLKNQAGATNYSPRPESRPITKFEKRGERLGHGVWDLLYDRV